jgi:bloom syndrome protein
LCWCRYVTPEQLVKSNALKEVLQKLHQRGRLARLVVDEVRVCLS